MSSPAPMIVRFIKQTVGADLLTCVRADGSTTSVAMPREGILPRAAFHYLVETTLGWSGGVYADVSRGHSAAVAIGETMSATPEPAGSGEQSGPPSQRLQGQALVACLQAEQWSGAASFPAFTHTLARASAERGVTPPALTEPDLQRLKSALRTFGAAWRPLAAGGVLERSFSP